MTAEVFNARTWRSFYDQVKILGQYLKDGRPDIDGNPPKYEIPPEERKLIEKEIDQLLTNTSRYLDQCRLFPRDPKWHYHRENETTWESSEKFKYANIMRKKKYIKVIV